MIDNYQKHNYIIVYERVAFIDISDDYLYFYKDYEMKDLVYKLKISDKTDMKLRAITSYSVAMNVLPDWKRHKDWYSLFV